MYPDTEMGWLFYAADKHQLRQLARTSDLDVHEISLAVDGVVLVEQVFIHPVLRSGFSSYQTELDCYVFMALKRLLARAGKTGKKGDRMKDEEIAAKIRELVAALNGYIDLAEAAGLKVDLCTRNSLTVIDSGLSVASITKTSEL
jgi:hypothetical protein